MGTTRKTTGQEGIRRAIKEAKATSPNADRNAKERRIDRWIHQLVNDLELWHSPNHEAYATIAVRGHHENWSIGSAGFRLCLTWLAMQERRPIPSKAELDRVCDALSAKALFAGPTYEPFTRIGEKDGRIYVDVGDENWICIEIQPADPDGEPNWRILTASPVKFLRRRSMLPLAKPTHGGDIDLLREFLNVETEGDVMLIVGWLLACYRARGPYPILLMNGPQGSGKTIILEFLRRLIDPIQGPARNLPSDERNLFAAAKSSHLFTYDNQSNISTSMSDALCRLAGGGGFSHRALNTNDDEHVIEASKPLLLNGITEITRREDLADRSIVVRSVKLRSEHRLPVEDLKEKFDAVESMILGALLDAVSYALRTYRDVPAPRIRMVDAGRFMIAGGEHFGWKRSNFANLLESNRLESIESVIESNPFTLTLLELLEVEPNWKGSATELLGTLNTRVDPNTKRLRSWPASASAASAALKRAKESLEARGFEFERGRDEGSKRERFIQFWKVKPAAQA